uniref:Uncharacterized protein n=1 Tax=Arundo donax TaxID=35708 RepID=A0A0A8YCF5_ARUDO
MTISTLVEVDGTKNDIFLTYVSLQLSISR